MVLDAIQKRYSSRSYLDQEVEKEKLQRVIEGARLAPSASNKQTYHLHVVTGNKVEDIANARSLRMNGFIQKANAFIVITQQKKTMALKVGQAIKDQDWSSIDIGIVCAYIDLLLQEEGLGCCILGMFDEKKIQNILGTSERVRLVLSIGYPADRPREKKRKPVQELAQWHE